MIKNTINALKVFKLIANNPAIFKVVGDIFKFVEKTQEEGRPMVTKIVLANMGDGTHLCDFVSLWAGVGETNPIERAKQLKAQNTELMRLLTIAKNGNVSKENIELIDLTLNHFG
jgi:hypothetical protein